LSSPEIEENMTDNTRQLGVDRWWPFAAGGGPTLALFGALWGASAWLRARYRNPLTQFVFLLVSGLWALVLYFFRDPNRQPPSATDLVLSPGDGEVVVITEEEERTYLGRACRRVSIFLSVFDVHVQRAPIAGTVRSVVHKPGQFLQAFRPEASELNEHIAMTIDSRYGPVLVKQIAGILARRCVNYATAGDVLFPGQRYGLIRFGSRVDLYLPLEAELLVAVGDRVYGGLTAIARFEEVWEDE
jgi:phosphatidylserine decarboxylase